MPLKPSVQGWSKILCLLHSFTFFLCSSWAHVAEDTKRIPIPREGKEVGFSFTSLHSSSRSALNLLCKNRTYHFPRCVWDPHICRTISSGMVGTCVPAPIHSDLPLDYCLLSVYDLTQSHLFLPVAPAFLKSFPEKVKTPTLAQFCARLPYFKSIFESELYCLSWPVSGSTWWLFCTF